MCIVVWNFGDIEKIACVLHVINNLFKSEGAKLPAMMYFFRLFWMMWP